MASNENLVQQYKKMLKKMLELKNLLADILISFHVIEEDNDESFHQMLSYVKQIETVYPYTNNNEFDASSEFFNSNEEIDSYLNENKNRYAKINLLLAQKINSYRTYLKDYLYTVGLNPNIINEDITLRHYIECLYQIERVKTTYIIIHDDATLYRNVQNSVPITIFDDTNEQIEDGYLVIKENDLVIYDGTLGEAYIQSSLIGTHTYVFEFTPTDLTHYKPSETTGTFIIERTPIDITIEAENINEYSTYYLSNSEGYAEDEWRITIQTKDSLGNIISDVPIKIYINDELVYEDRTNIIGQYTYTCQLPYSSDYNGQSTPFRVETASFNPAFLNQSSTKNFTIYHHLLEIDNEFYIGQTNPLSIYLVDELTGEPLTTITTGENITYDDDGNEIIEEIVVNHPLLGADITITVTLNDQHSTKTLHFDNNKWTFDEFSDFIMNANDVAYLHITSIDYDETQIVTIKSNFILPKENVFYLPFSNLPKIYYKPLGNVCEEGNIIGEWHYYFDSSHSSYLSAHPTFTVSNSEIVNYMRYEYKGAGDYRVVFYSRDEDPINETVSFDFTVKKPLQLTQTSYEQTGCATYQVNVYDKKSLDRLQNHIATDTTEQYTITTPNEFNIELLNDDYSVITIYDADTDIITIENEYDKITINEETHSLSRDNVEWNKITISFDDTYKVYIDGTLMEEIDEQHDELEVYVLAPTSDHYRNVKIKNLYNPIAVTNNGNEIDYVYTLTETSDAYTYNISICRDNYNQGSNTICSTINGYVECDTFDLYSRSFYILPTNQLKVGHNTIQIQCFNEDANSIDIEHNNILVHNVTKNDNIYTIECDIYEAGALPITLTDDQEDSENFVINVAKGDYTISLDMPEVKEYQDHTPIPLSIKDAFNNEVNTFYCYFDQETPISITKTDNSITLVNNAISRQFDDLEMGDHTITVRTMANSNYNDAVVTKEFLMGIYIRNLTNQPLFTDLSVDNDGWLVNDTMNVDNATTVGDLEDVLVGINTSVDVDPGQLLLSNFISSSADLDSIVLLDDDFNNIQNAIIDIDVDEDKLTYDTIEDDNL